MTNLSVFKREDENLRPPKFLLEDSVTRFGDLLDFGQIFKVFGNN